MSIEICLKKYKVIVLSNNKIKGGKKMNEKLKTIKNKGKELFNHIFIDGLKGMA